MIVSMRKFWINLDFSQEEHMKDHNLKRGISQIMRQGISQFSRRGVAKFSKSVRSKR